jgi:ribose transport system substrate-binding protein
MSPQIQTVLVLLSIVSMVPVKVAEVSRRREYLMELELLTRARYLSKAKACAVALARLVSNFGNANNHKVSKKFAGRKKSDRLQVAVTRIAAALCFFLTASTCTAQDSPLERKMWSGPTTGPIGQSDKKVTFLSQDFRNGGISTIYRSFSSAALLLGWHVKLVDGNGDTKVLRAEFSKAIESHQDAIVFGGFQADQDYSDLVDRARQSKIVLVGWHADTEPRSSTALFANIATQSSEVAKIAVDYVIQNSSGDIGIIIFNDNRFSVANMKTTYMKDAISKCSRCKLLSVENLLISNANNEVPAAVIRLNQMYGKAWTHTLAINDVYFDSMNKPLISIGRTDIQNISAGDGSNVAMSRIGSGKSQQAATVAEPSGIQGWQLADELNRAFAGQPPSGYVSKPILVTTLLLTRLNGRNIDSEIPYKKAYADIWSGAQAGK